MDYDEAKILDQRTFCQFFGNSLKSKLIIIDTFIIDNIRPISIKFLLLFTLIDLFFFANGLFYSEDYISDVYHSAEKENFFSFIPRSINRFIYTLVVETILDYLIKCFFIENIKIKKSLLRYSNDKTKLQEEILEYVQKIKKNYNNFIIVSLFISIISWFYISCFNNAYRYIKYEWIKSSFTFLFFQQIIVFIAVFLESAFRFLSFKCESEKVFKFSKFFSRS